MKKTLLYLVSILLITACSGGDDGGVTPSAGSEYLNIPKDLIVVQGNTTTTLQINASQNLSWTIACDQTWVSFSQQSGRGTAYVTVTVTANPSSTESRMATITVMGSSYTRESSLKQEPDVAYLNLSVSSLNFTNMSGNQQVTVSSNTEWAVIESDEDWISVSPRARTGESTVITVQLTENTNEAERKKTFTIKGGNISKQLEVVQSGRSTDFTVSPTSLTAEAKSLKVQFSITGEARWIISSNRDWAKPSDMQGEGNKTITVTLDDNILEEQQQAIITITSATNTVKSEQVTITQKAATRPVISDLTYTDVTRSEATVSFSFISMYPVTEYGICYSINENPTIINTHVKEEGSALQGVYSTKLTGLTAGTTYYVRAYAISKVNTGYSEEIIFKTAQGEQPNVGDNPQPGW